MSSNHGASRQSTFNVSFAAAGFMPGGQRELVFNVANVPVVWKWDDMSREAAELWAAIDYMAHTVGAEHFSIGSITSSPTKDEVTA